MGVYKRAGKKSFIARIARKGMRKAGQAIKKRYVSGGRVNVNQVVRDVAVVKRMLNAEKKMLSLNVNGILIGQVVGNISGYYTQDITPAPANGTAGSEKTGRSIKMCSYHCQMQLIQQSSAIGRQNYKIMIFKTLGLPVNSSQFVSDYFANNGFIGGASIIDYNSNVNPDSYGRYKKIFEKRVTLEPDSVSGQTGFKTIQFGGKFNHHVRFSGSTTTVNNGQLWMIVLADSGNCSPTVSSTLTNIPQTGTNTGATINYQMFRYYYDN